MPLLAKFDEVRAAVPKKTAFMQGNNLFTKKVYGNELSLMYATRSAGYHSFPHTHDAEQLNFCMKGEIWIFVDEDAHLLREGDFHRVPRGAIHWAWNRSDGDIILLEAHTPPLISFPENQELEACYVGLYSETEAPNVVAKAANIFQEQYREHQKRVEARLFPDVATVGK
jgi:quercetin dioxygenase-like cupin family protein